MADDENIQEFEEETTEIAVESTGEFEALLDKYKNSNLYDCNETTIRGSDFVIFKTAQRSGKKIRRDVRSKSLRTQCDRVSDLIFKVRLLKF